MRKKFLPKTLGQSFSCCLQNSSNNLAQSQPAYSIIESRVACLSCLSSNSSLRQRWTNSSTAILRGFAILAAVQTI